MPVLTTHNLSVGFTRGKQVTTLLHDLDLSLDSGTLVALLGQNGAGKSTLLRAITCSTLPLGGEIFINGAPATSYSRRQLSRLVGLVSTERIAADALTVTEIVGLGRQPHTGFLGRMSDSDHEIVTQAINDVGMTHKASSYIAELSDGERQKVMIAKALAQQTPIIVLDEPTAFLDVASRIETMNLLAQLAHENGKAVLLSTHDMAQALQLADRLWLITRDRRVLQGDTHQLMQSDTMNQLFDNENISFNPTLLDYQYTKPS